MKIYLSVLLLVSIFLVSCGKVTQVTDKKETVRSYDLLAMLEVVATTNLQNTSTASSRNASGTFSVLDDTIFIQIIGLRDKGVHTELAWGQGTLARELFTPSAKIENSPVSGNRVATMNPKTASLNTKKNSSNTINIQNSAPVWRYVSSALRKDGVTLTQADHTWIKPTFQENKMCWQIEAKKIENDYPLYLICGFSDNQKYFLKIWDHRQVSGNAIISLNNLTKYDTFIALLYLRYLDEYSNGIINEAGNLADLSALFDQDFFYNLQYKMPPNNVKNLDEKKPLLFTSGSLESYLLKIYKMVISDNKKEAIATVKQEKDIKISAKGREILQKNINRFAK